LTAAAPSTQVYRWIRYAALAVFVIACIAAIHRGRNYDPNGAQTCDFISPYSGARCLLHGCDPYAQTDLQAQYVAAHGSLSALDERHNWNVLLPVYPPSTFLLIAPLTIFDYPTAQAIWFYTGALLFCIATGLLTYFVEREMQWLYLLLAAVMLWSANTDFLLGPGQPSTFAIAFTALAVWAFYKTDAKWLGVIFLALGLAMKPHMAIAVFLFLLLRKGLKREAIAAGALAILLLGAAIVWLQISMHSFAWFANFQHAVSVGIAPGGTNEPSPANPSGMHIINIQTIVSIWASSPHVYGLISLLLVVAIGALWLWTYLKAGNTIPSPQSDLFAMAGLLCLSLLPVYHRDYDARLLLLTIPPMVWLLRRHLGLGLVVLAVSTPLLFCQTTMHTLKYLLVHHRGDFSQLSSIETLLYLRQQSIALLALAIVWPIAYYLSSQRAVTTKST
jgi:hypothetical protein